MESNQNITSESEHRFVFSTVLVGLVFGMITLITIFGNVLVCLVVGLNRNLQSHTNCLIVSLAATDLLLGLLVMPFSATLELLNSEWPFGSTFCNIYTSLDVMLSTASILNLFMISLERYLAVTAPLRYTTVITPKRVTISLSLIWCISIMFSFLPIHMGWNTKEQTSNKTNECYLELNTAYAIVDAFITFYIPLVIMSLTYYKIFKIAREQARRINITSRNTILKEHKATVTLATVMGVFIICWFPYFTVFLHDGISGIRSDNTTFVVVLWLGYVNSGMNPIVYAVLNRDFRMAYQKLLFCRKGNVRSKHSPFNHLACQSGNEQCHQLVRVLDDNEPSSDVTKDSKDTGICKEDSER
ncbi:histamine H2 receptor-like [Pristis pectinata]|uniref:histamine H2 receptor-like n=1 Tax=Pristis pectinata TaxID=685728 RepID=UPI00223DFD56|nr:histamine H2 receptor-like [Pristis pectinata]